MRLRGAPGMPGLPGQKVREVEDSIKWRGFELTINYFCISPQFPSN